MEKGENSLLQKRVFSSIHFTYFSHTLNKNEWGDINVKYHIMKMNVQGFKIISISRDSFYISNHIFCICNVLFSSSRFVCKEKLYYTPPNHVVCNKNNFSGL